MNAPLAVALVAALAWAGASEFGVGVSRVETAMSSAEAGQVKLGEPPPDPEKRRKSAIERAKAYLCKTAKIEAGEIVVESATPATWPDASLGCPEKDRMYAQVVTEGYKVILRAGESTHELHVSPKRVVLCKPACG